MGADNFVNSEVGGKRSERRSRVLLAAKLKTPFGEIDVRLRDLSRRGALIECSRQPPVGSEVTFIRGTIIIPARVAWASAGKAGLEFHYQIDEQEMLVRLKKTSSAPSTERFRRPGLNETMPEDERRFAREWGVTVGLTVPEGRD
jgi:hypothetical protein